MPMTRIEIKSIDSSFASVGGIPTDVKTSMPVSINVLIKSAIEVQKSVILDHFFCFFQCLDFEMV